MTNPKIIKIIKKFIITNFVILIWIILFLIYLKAKLFIPANPTLYDRYLISAFIPVLITNCILTILIIKPAVFSSFIYFDKNYYNKNIFLIIIIVFFSIIASYFPNPDISLIYLVVGIAFIISCWAIIFNSTNQLLAFWFPINFILLLIILNMIPPTGNWGRVTHLYKFPKKKPITGQGGRLVPNLDIYLKGYDTPTPKKFITNEQGFRNSYKINLSKNKNDLRILNIGDSYSIGYHLDQESFLGPLLEKNIKSKISINIEVLNAAISDPSYGLYYTQNYGIHYNPDLIILGLCGNDFVQAYSFASEGQRFIVENNKITINNNQDNFKNATRKYKNYLYLNTNKDNNLIKNPIKSKNNYSPYNSLVGLRNLSTIRYLKYILGIKNIETPRSYEINRNPNKIQLIDGFPNIGFFLKNRFDPVEEIYKVNFNIFKIFKKISSEIDAQFVLLYFPSPFEIINEEWANLCLKWELNPHDFNLSKHRDRIREFANNNDILFVDPTQFLINSNLDEKLFLPKDAHFSEIGHEKVSDYLSKILIKNFNQTD